MALLQRAPHRRAAATEKLIQVAEFHEARGEFAAAEDTYRRALTVSPGNSDLQDRLLAVRELKRRQQAEARDTMEQLDGPQSVLAANRRRRDEALAGKSSPLRVRATSWTSGGEDDSAAEDKESDSGKESIRSRDSEEDLLGRVTPLP
jgi:Tfp pilus assembly protein PilF